ncbi:hypothetical protein AJ79_04135 [Helicocarpus griseus UAMH5409]|uniref:Cenp-O kinetochore centromere component n=1 Tax=Helicocarpus griseus UAMH5409 TaxID=1447875 RepID=A0A2B7XVV7_9EURO|nr:hypothetical protein AJ79_04135 [Helicocarpus griseus UAMH5409]
MSADAQTSPADDALSRLDNEIAAIRAEIHNLTNRRKFLSSSLLSTNIIQETLRQHVPSGLEGDIDPVILNSGKHAQTNHHRIAFSTTSFPFKDPSPHTKSPNLLGIRIDICTRRGSFAKPYYLLLKRVGPEQKLLQVHRHTIPIFIPLKQLEQRYLAVPREENGIDPATAKPWKTPKQDLRKLVRELRRELVAWHLRRDALGWLQEELGVSENKDEADGTQFLSYNLSGDEAPRNDLGIISVTATALETRYIRFEWRDGRVGRIKLSNRGLIERAIIIAEEGRDKITENLLISGDGRIEGAIERLRGAAEPG